MSISKITHRIIITIRYVLKEDLFQYEAGESKDIYEWLSVKEYSKLADDVKQAYQYYEWNNPMGWYAPFVDITEHVKWQVYAFESVNSYGPQEYP